MLSAAPPVLGSSIIDFLAAAPLLPLGVPGPTPPLFPLPGVLGRDFPGAPPGVVPLGLPMLLRAVWGVVAVAGAVLGRLGAATAGLKSCTRVCSLSNSTFIRASTIGYGVRCSAFSLAAVSSCLAAVCAACLAVARSHVLPGVRRVVAASARARLIVKLARPDRALSCT